MQPPKMRGYAKQNMNFQFFTYNFGPPYSGSASSVVVGTSDDLNLAHWLQENPKHHISGCDTCSLFQSILMKYHRLSVRGSVWCKFSYIIAISIWTVSYTRYKQYQRKLPPLYTIKSILESLRKLSKKALQEKGQR